MKSHVQNTLVFIILIFGISCKRDYDPCDVDPSTYSYLSEENKNKVPYNGDEILIFTNNYGDTAICIGKGREQFFTKKTWWDYACNRSRYTHYEAFKVKFDDEYDKFNIEITGYYYDEQLNFGTIHYKINGLNDATFTGYLHTSIPKWETYIINLPSKSYRTIPFTNLDNPTDTIFVNLNKGIIALKVNNIKWQLYDYN